MKIAAMPPAMPPAMAPTFELRPPAVALLDVALPDVALFEVELPETGGAEGPSIVPGPSSGEPIKVRRGCHDETVTGR
jgi:hypothetical protein